MMKPTSARRRASIGLLVGAVVGIGIIGGILALVPSLLAVILVSREAPRDGAVGGVLVGFGLAWLALFGSAAARCGVGCSSPGLGPWFAIAAASLLLGLILSIRAVTRAA